MKPVPSPADVLKREQAKAKREKLEATLLQQLRAFNLTMGMVREYVFSSRKFRADFAWPGPEFMLLVEVDGGTWNAGRHATGTGIERDAEKGAAAAIAGYRVIHLTTGQVTSGLGAKWIEQALGAVHQRQRGE